MSTTGTLINICAILSKLDKHEEAIKYVSKAIHILENALSELDLEGLL
jgi:hypothetical protein